MRFAENLKRFFLAWFVALVSVAVCIWKGLFHVDVAQPSTALKVLPHCYGILMVVSVGWLWFEAVLLLLSPAVDRRKVRWPRRRVGRER